MKLEIVCAKARHTVHTPKCPLCGVVCKALCPAPTHSRTGGGGDAQRALLSIRLSGLLGPGARPHALHSVLPSLAAQTP